LTQVAGLSLSRDPHHGLVTSTSLDSTSDTRAYNGFGELTSFKATASGTQRFATDYTRDVLGRISRLVETILGVTTTYDYSYDLAGRLVDVKQNGTSTYTYAYDANGNRTSTSTPGGSAAGTYDAQDRLTQYGATTYAYNTNGQLQSRSVGVQT